MVAQQILLLGRQFYRYYGCSLLLLDNEPSHRTTLFRGEGFSIRSKGILIAALFLLTLPIILNLPGLLSFHILGEGLNPIDTSYPLLVNKVMPTALQGFFIAALFGAILSTFNSFLNSAATIYCKDLLPSISKNNVLIKN